MKKLNFILTRFYNLFSVERTDFDFFDVLLFCLFPFIGLIIGCFHIIFRFIINLLKKIKGDF